MKTLFTCVILFIFYGIISAASYSNIVSYNVNYVGNAAIISFVVCSNTSPGEGIAVEAQYGPGQNQYLKSVANLSYIGDGSCSGGAGALFNVEITLPSDVGSVNFQSFATNPYGSINDIPGTFSGFNTPLTILPLRFVSFESQEIGTHLWLKWETADEENNRLFEIERSIDLKEWLFIGKTENGSERSANKFYLFEDPAPKTGLSYYRIKQVDMDGKFSYSSILPVKRDLQKALIIAPNPVVNGGFSLFLGQNDEEYKMLEIYSSQGSLVKKQSISSTASFVDVSDLSIGVYMIRLGNMDKTQIFATQLLIAE